MTSLKDICWLAGILEGEGCFSINTSTIRISFTSTDRDIAERVAHLLKAKVKCRLPWSKGTAAFNQKLVYIVSASRHATEWMMTIYPLMGERRRAKIRELLIHWRAMVGHGVIWERRRAKYGPTGTPPRKRV